MAISICGATLKPFKGDLPAYAIAAELSGEQYMVYIYIYICIHLAPRIYIYIYVYFTYLGGSQGLEL